MKSLLLGCVDSDWQRAYRMAPLSVGDLLERLAIPLDRLPFEVDPDSPFAVKVPPHFLSLIRPGDPLDPLLLQVLARAHERLTSEAEDPDPLREAGSFKRKGVIQKYPGRALVLLSGVCAIHCRYCFRRHYDYGSVALGASEVDDLVSLLEADATIREVILSGGDPLSVSDEKLAALLLRLSAISSLRSIRIHTRTLSAVPERTTQGLLTALTGCAKPVTIVTHINHPREIDPIGRDSLRRVRQAGVLLLNQSALLRHVNDDAETLAELSWTLHGAGVVPYYLNMLDEVAGSSHFAVTLGEAAALQEALRVTLPGYLVPRFVKETPGARFKVPLDRLGSGSEYQLEQ